MTAYFDHKEALTETISSYFFRLSNPIEYTPGQFVEVTIPHKHPDDRGQKRWFTLSSSPIDKDIAITTRFVSGQSSSFKSALDGLMKGAEIVVSDPMGDFVLPKMLQTPLIFVAAGIGITPFHSMLRYLSQTSEQRPITMLYAVRDEEDIIFQDAFQQANQHVTIIVSKPSAAWGGEQGSLSAELILGLKPVVDDTLIYISGPEPLVEQLQRQLIRSGAKKQQLVTDFFPGYESI